jgi:hypothetical protein
LSIQRRRRVQIPPEPAVPEQAPGNGAEQGRDDEHEAEPAGNGAQNPNDIQRSHVRRAARVQQACRCYRTLIVNIHISFDIPICDKQVFASQAHLCSLMSYLLLSIARYVNVFFRSMVRRHLFPLVILQ